MKRITPKHAVGFTLVELMVTLAILSIIVITALPNFQNLMASLEAKRVSTSLSTFIRNSKQRAYVHHQRIGLCGSSNSSSCDRTGWSTGMIMFHDNNANRLRDSSEQIFDQIRFNLKYGTLSWQGVGRTNSLLFQPDTGLPRGSNGSFTYCSQNNLHQNVILSNMGHVRVERITTC